MYGEDTLLSLYVSADPAQYYWSLLRVLSGSNASELKL